MSYLHFNKKTQCPDCVKPTYFIRPILSHKTKRFSCKHPRPHVQPCSPAVPSHSGAVAEVLKEEKEPEHEEQIELANLKLDAKFWGVDPPKIYNDDSPAAVQYIRHGADLDQKVPNLAAILSIGKNLNCYMNSPSPSMCYHPPAAARLDPSWPVAERNLSRHDLGTALVGTISGIAEFVDRRARVEVAHRAVDISILFRYPISLFQDILSGYPI